MCLQQWDCLLTFKCKDVENWIHMVKEYEQDYFLLEVMAPLKCVQRGLLL